MSIQCQSLSIRYTVSLESSWAARVRAVASLLQSPAFRARRRPCDEIGAEEEEDEEEHDNQDMDIGGESERGNGKSGTTRKTKKKKNNLNKLGEPIDPEDCSGSVIIYVFRRFEAERLAKELKSQHGIEGVLPYHAGLPSHQRNRTQSRFMIRDEIKAKAAKRSSRAKSKGMKREKTKKRNEMRRQKK